MNYEQQTARGRSEAAHDLAAVRETGNIPLLVRKIREAAADETGFGAGYLFTLGDKAAFHSS